jgi:hypothetical protein
MAAIDLGYDPDTLAGPVDPRVVRWIEEHRRRFDPSYLDHIQRFHGGIPGKQYFDTPQGETMRVGRFLTLVDEETPLPPPFCPSWQYPNRDVRIDRSVLTLIDEEGPSCRQLLAGEDILPFAALYRGDLDPDGMSLLEGECDLLCFDYRLGAPRPQVVIWDAYASLKDCIRRDRSRDDTVRYEEFIRPVASDFDAFLRLLRESP